MKKTGFVNRGHLLRVPKIVFGLVVGLLPQSARCAEGTDSLQFSEQMTKWPWELLREPSKTVQ